MSWNEDLNFEFHRILFDSIENIKKCNFLYLVHETLDNSQRGNKWCMNWEEHIVKLDWVCSSGKSSEIFFLEKWCIVKTCIENCIKSVTQKVQCQKIKAQSDNRFSLEVYDHLRIEWDGPCYKVNPSDNLWDVDYCSRVGDNYLEEEIKVIDNASWDWCSTNVHMAWNLSIHWDIELIRLICRYIYDIRRYLDKIMMLCSKVYFYFLSYWSAVKSFLLISSLKGIFLKISL